MTEERAATRAKLLAHIREMADSSSGIELDSYLIKHGSFFMPAPLPTGDPELMKIFRSKADCYKMSELLAKSDPALEYVEGWAVAPNGVPTRHAWCVDGDGRVIDAQWDSPETLEYFGVVIPRDFGYDWRGVFTPGQALAIEQRERDRRDAESA